MPSIVDNRGHVLGVQHDDRAVLRHKGRSIVVEGGTITIVCEECKESVTIFLDSARTSDLGLATTK